MTAMMILPQEANQITQAPRFFILYDNSTQPTRLSNPFSCYSSEVIETGVKPGCISTSKGRFWMSLMVSVKGIIISF